MREWTVPEIEELHVQDTKGGGMNQTSEDIRGGQLRS